MDEDIKTLNLLEHHFKRNTVIKHALCFLMQLLHLSTDPLLFSQLLHLSHAGKKHQNINEAWTWSLKH